MSNFADRAALAELIASAAVVISLLLVAYSIRRKEWRLEIRSDYKPEFAEHVDSKYAQK